MMLSVIIEDQLFELNVPEAFLDQADDFFQGMDRDMDQGVQMSRDWVDNPGTEQRCRIVADKLMGAIEQQNEVLGRLMAGYILRRMPAVETIHIDTDGEIQNTRFTFKEGQAGGPPGVEAAADTADSALREQAEKEVSQVFKVGRNWRFAVYDRAGDQWREAPLAGSEEEAQRLRGQAVRERIQALGAEEE